MASERLTHTQTRLQAYYDAEIAVLAGQAYTLGSRSLTRADLVEIKKGIKELENLVEELKAVDEGRGHRRAFRITIRDL